MATLCHTEYAAQKKMLLENSLLDLLETVRYQDITVKDICQKADIPRRTFYHYFGCKEDVLAAIIEDLIQECFLLGMHDLRLNIDNMRKNFIRIFRFWTGDNRRKLNCLMKTGLESRLMACAIQWVRTEGIYFPQMEELDQKLVEIGLTVGVTDFFTLLFYWSRGGYKETPEQMAEYAIWVLPQVFYHL